MLRSWTVEAGDLAKGRGPRLDQFLVSCLASASMQASALPEADCAGGGITDEELDDSCTNRTPHVPALSREAVKKAVLNGACRINGKAAAQASVRLKLHDKVEFMPPEAEEAAAPEEGELNVLYEDEHLLVLVKPAGLVVHPCPSCPSGTLIQRVLFAYPEVAAMGGMRPGIVHRLDKETSGLLIVARNEETRLALSQAFAERRVLKEYLAAVWGKPAREGSSTKSIGRHPDKKTRMACVPLSQGGKNASTDYTTLWTAEDSSASLVRMRIHTGRTHQIRVHMTDLGHPLLGDATYAEGPCKKAQDMAPRVMLHAFHLAFTHPATGKELEFFLPPPEDMEQCLLNLASKTQCLVVTGNPGSGKSTLTKLFAGQDIPTISADELVHGYYAANGAVQSLMLQRFGAEALDEKGDVDRTWLMRCFAENPVLKREVEDYVHQLVLYDIAHFFTDCTKRHEKRAAAEIPLYFECGFHKKLTEFAPLAIGIRAGLGIRCARLNKTRGWSDEKSTKIESWQWDEEKKMAACRLVIDNIRDEAALQTSFLTMLLPALDKILDKEQEAFKSFLASLWEKLKQPVRKEGKD